MQKRAGAKKTKEYQEQFLDITIPKTIEVIRKFYFSQDLKDLVAEMVGYADKLANGQDVHVPERLLHQLNELVPVLIFCRAGNRPELAGHLTRGQFETAKADRANPNKPLHLDERVPKDHIKDRIHDGMYINPDPDHVDPNDPEPDP